MLQSGKVQECHPMAQPLLRPSAAGASPDSLCKEPAAEAVNTSLKHCKICRAPARSLYNRLAVSQRKEGGTAGLPAHEGDPRERAKHLLEVVRVKHSRENPAAFSPAPSCSLFRGGPSGCWKWCVTTARVSRGAGSSSLKCGGVSRAGQARSVTGCSELTPAAE